MIPYLTDSQAATELSVAASVKQEAMLDSELNGTSPPQSSAPMTPMTPQTGYGHLSPGDGSYQSANLVSPSAGNPALQSILCQPIPDQLGNSPMGVLLSSPSSVLSYGASEQQQQQQQQTQQGPVMNSMDTNPVSFSNLNLSHPSMDPMATLKVDSLTLHDKAPLPQLSLSDISKQLAMPAVVSCSSQTNLNLVPIDTVMAEKPIMFASEVNSSTMHGTAAEAVSSLSAVGSMLDSSGQSSVGVGVGGSSGLSGASVIMSPANYSQLVSSEQSKCSNGMLSATANYLNANGLVQADLKSQGLSPAAVLDALQSAQQSQTLAQQQHQEKLTNSSIESFIENMTSNDSLANGPGPADHSLRSMLSTALTGPSNSTPAYLNASLIANVAAANNSLMLNTAVSNSRQQQTGVIASGPTAPNNGSVMMDTLPSTLRTNLSGRMTPNVCSTGTHSVISSLGSHLESVSMPGFRGPVQFTDNVEMTGAGAVSNGVSVAAMQQQQQQSLVNSQQQQPMQHTGQQTFSTMTTLSMSDADLLNFINPATFE